jgi:hypothetical protein
MVALKVELKEELKAAPKVVNKLDMLDNSVPNGKLGSTKEVREDVADSKVAPKVEVVPSRLEVVPSKLEVVPSKLEVVPSKLEVGLSKQEVVVLRAVKEDMVVSLERNGREVLDNRGLVAVNKVVVHKVAVPKVVVVVLAHLPTCTWTFTIIKINTALEMPISSKVLITMSILTTTLDLVRDIQWGNPKLLKLPKAVLKVVLLAVTMLAMETTKR